MHAMTEAGILPDTDDLFDTLAEDWSALLSHRMDAMSAEMTGVDFAASVRAASLGHGDDRALYADVIGHTEQRADAVALAMLRVVAATAPGEVRTAAAQAADRVAAGGVRDRKWATDLGSPAFVTAFGYADPHGAQEAIALVYAYGRRQHALVALIDHDLGGGIKDVWPTDEPKEVRAQYRLATRMTGMDLRTYGAEEARAILDRALASPTCAVQEDQIEDVDRYVDLLRRRAALLPQPAVGAPLPAPGAGSARRPATRSLAGTTNGRKTSVHRIKVTLQGTKPPVWRRLEVPSDVTLTRLHAVIQEAFGWYNAHMWVFETGSDQYGVPDPERGHRNAERTTLQKVAPRTGERLGYVYDFGDDWQHTIVVEDIAEPEPGVAYPRCLAGRRAAPPEDCGGRYGYADLLEVLDDPGHDEHQNMLAWLNVE
jgi:hypothetical protein